MGKGGRSSVGVSKGAETRRDARFIPLNGPARRVGSLFDMRESDAEWGVDRGVDWGVWTGVA